jgi:hypothetical protein
MMKLALVAAVCKVAAPAVLAVGLVVTGCGPADASTTRVAPATGAQAMYLDRDRVECFEDLTCTDGSGLATWDCSTASFVDDLGRLVRSNGRCA